MRKASDLPRDGDQLRLDLFAGVPWDGQSPRALTRGFIPLFLRQKPPSHEVFLIHEQFELWPIDRPPREEGPRRVLSVGAHSFTMYDLEV